MDVSFDAVPDHGAGSAISGHDKGPHVAQKHI